MPPRNTILTGDALTNLRTLPSASIDLVLTSPPYFQLRRYGDDARELGQESEVDAWVTALRSIAREVHRVLAPHGAFYLNIADSYSKNARFGAPAKSLLLGPERLARGLLADGWLVRNRILWTKPNPLPSPVKDRLTNSYELVYFLVKQPNYWADLDAIRRPLRSRRRPSRSLSRTPQWALGALAGDRDGLVAMARKGLSGHPLGANPSDHWSIASSGYRGGHHATFPPELARRPILFSCPAHVCAACGKPWRRSARRVTFLAGEPQPRPFVPCGCGAPTRPGLVLDCFGGTGTTAEAARALGRDWLLIELSPGYVELARQRLGLDSSDLARAA